MLHLVRSDRVPPQDIAGDAPWHRDLDALERLLRASRPTVPSRDALAALIEAEVPGALPPVMRDRLAARLAGYLTENPAG
ncbi:MAG: hypothetical protein PGN34_11985 [Methylobacterium frigidaeris]